jgi:hypothetical protein
MLALEVGRTVSADRLAEGLWGEEPPSSAPKMVQLYVSRLRRLLDGNGALIVTRGRGYELQLSDGAVDAVTAERLLDQSRARDAGISPGRWRDGGRLDVKLPPPAPSRFDWRSARPRGARLVGFAAGSAIERTASAIAVVLTSLMGRLSWRGGARTMGVWSGTVVS